MVVYFRPFFQKSSQENVRNTRCFDTKNMKIYIYMYLMCCRISSASSVARSSIIKISRFQNTPKNVDQRKQVSNIDRHGIKTYNFYYLPHMQSILDLIYVKMMSISIIFKLDAARWSTRGILWLPIQRRVVERTSFYRLEKIYPYRGKSTS